MQADAASIIHHLQQCIVSYTEKLLNRICAINSARMYDLQSLKYESCALLTYLHSSLLNSQLLRRGALQSGSHTTNEKTRPMANSSLLVPLITPMDVVRPMTCTPRNIHKTATNDEPYAVFVSPDPFRTSRLRIFLP